MATPSPLLMFYLCSNKKGLMCSFSATFMRVRCGKERGDLTGAQQRIICGCRNWVYPRMLIVGQPLHRSYFSLPDLWKLWWRVFLYRSCVLS
ncbi:unnamed protein product [Victoria cruziana]